MSEGLLVVAMAVAGTMAVPVTGTSASATYALWQQQAVAASRRPEMTAVVPAHEEALPRIGRFAGGTFASLGSTAQGVRAAKADRLLVDGEVVPPTRRVRPGDVVTLLPPPLADASTSVDERAVRFAEGLLRSGSLSVLHEDESFAIIHKPAGVHTKPYGGPLALEHALPAILQPPTLLVRSTYA